MQPTPENLRELAGRKRRVIMSDSIVEINTALEAAAAEIERLERLANPPAHFVPAGDASLEPVNMADGDDSELVAEVVELREMLKEAQAELELVRGERDAARQGAGAVDVARYAELERAVAEYNAALPPSPPLEPIAPVTAEGAAGDARALELASEVVELKKAAAASAAALQAERDHAVDALALVAAERDQAKAAAESARRDLELATAARAAAASAVVGDEARKNLQVPEIPTHDLETARLSLVAVEGAVKDAVHRLQAERMRYAALVAAEDARQAAEDGRQAAERAAAAVGAAQGSQSTSGAENGPEGASA